MNPIPTLITILEHSHVSPPPATTVSSNSLPLTFYDMLWFVSPEPVHTLFFYDLPITTTHFTQSLVPNLKQSLSITLQHFFPFAGKLNIFPTTASRLPEIRYVEGTDSVAFTVAECNNLDFNGLTGNHPRQCDKFYELIPQLGRVEKVSDYCTIPVFAVQVTLFPDRGISIGMTYHHCLGDASTTFRFRKAWALIAQSGSSDMSFLDDETLPVYDRLFKYPQLDESYMKKAKVETFKEGFQFPRLSATTDKVRATFILTRTFINGLKKLVSTQLPTLAYISSFTVASAYIWNCFPCLDDDERVVLYTFVVDCRSRMDPPIPPAYFGNCLMSCFNFARTADLKEKGGFVTAAKLIGENLHKMLTDKDGVVKDIVVIENLFRDGSPAKIIGTAGSHKIKFYEFDLGFGKPKKYETISIDYSGSISMSACRECNEDMEIGVCLSASEMDVFVHNFNNGLESYI